MRVMRNLVYEDDCRDGLSLQGIFVANHIESNNKQGKFYAEGSARERYIANCLKRIKVVLD